MDETRPIQVLHVEDCSSDSLLTERALRKAGLSAAVKRVETAGAMRRAIAEQTWDIVLSDYALPELDIGDVLTIVQEQAPGAPVVVVTGAVGEEAVAELMRRGIADVVLKDRLSPRLGAIVRREVDNARQRLMLDAQRQRSAKVLSLFGEAEDWREAVEATLAYLGADFGAEMTVMFETSGSPAHLQPLATWCTNRLAPFDAILRAKPLPAENTVIGRAMLRGEPMLVPHLNEQIAGNALLLREAMSFGVTSAIGYPIEVTGRHFAMLLMFTEPRAGIEATLGDLIAVSRSLQPALLRKLLEYERDLLRDALDAALSGVIITDATIEPPGPRIVYANQEVGRMSGYEPRDLLGESPRILQGRDTNRNALDQVRRALAAAEPVSVELWNYHRDGTPYLVKLDITPVRDQGQVTHFIAIETDITALRQAEQERLAREAEICAIQLKAEVELRAAKDRAENAERLLRDAIESMSEGFVIFDRDDRLVMCNSVYRRLYSEAQDILVPGVSYENILWQVHLGEAATPETRDKLARWIAERVAQHHEAKPVTYEQQLRGGSWVLVNDRPMTNGGITGLRVDITAMKQVQEALRESEARLDRAQDIAGIGSWEMDIGTGQFFWSKQSYRICGVSPETFVPTVQNVNDYTHPDDIAAMQVWSERLTNGLRPEPREVRIIRADGELRTVRVEGRPVAWDGDKVIRVAGTMQDITEQRRLEHQVVQAQKMDAIGNLTGGMAHDFNNMLGVIMVNLELLQSQIGGDAAAAELCAEALDGANRCAGVVSRLLAFARRQPLQPQPTDANAWIRDVTRLLGRTLGENIKLTLDLDEDLWPVMVDPVQFEATLVNLATNARDAMAKGGELSITTLNARLGDAYVALHPFATVGDHVLIEISDTGTGIPADIIPRVFEPFFTTKGPGKGTGLGLSMAFGFVRQSGGHLTVQSEPGLGATFRIYLPRHSAGGEPAAVPAADEPAVGGHECVLAVEDNPQLRRAVARQLAELGYRVREADQAATAMEILKSGEQVDLLLTDVVMPGTMDGLELAYQAVRRQRGLKVLLASGYPGMRDGEHRTTGKPFPLLNKPYNRDQLARAVRMVLDKAGDASTDGDHDDQSGGGAMLPRRAWRRPLLEKRTDETCA